MDSADDQIDCPFCAELIKAAAIKCRYCGEFVSADPMDPLDADAEPTPPTRHVWRYNKLALMEGWRCIDHNKMKCGACLKIVVPPNDRYWKRQGQRFPDPTRPYSGRIGTREKLTKVGDSSDLGPSCPRCGGTDFTAKRSIKGKVAAGVLAPKTQLKCVACGAKFKRG